MQNSITPGGKPVPKPPSTNVNASLELDILTQAFDDLPVGVGVFQVCDLHDNESIRYVFMNKVILYEMRKTREEVFGKRIMEVAPEAYEHEGGLRVIETYRTVAKEGGSINLGLVEYSNHMVAGTYECSVHYIKDNYVYVMLRNVTELEETKNELENKNKELSQLTSIVSHDLKEPLNTISGFVEVITENYQETLNDDVSEFIGYISKATTRMRRVVTDLLDYSRIGGKRKEMTMVDTEKMMEEIRQDLSGMIRETNTSIVLGHLPLVRGFETELRLLFQNLICNSIKFNRPGVTPNIKVSAKRQDGWTFIIKDNGIGIAKEYQDSVFRMFKRLHTKSEYEGTGIGLAHCKKIVELHNGNIWVESTPGEGSVFYCNFPDEIYA